VSPRPSIRSRTPTRRQVLGAGIGAAAAVAVGAGGYAGGRLADDGSADAPRSAADDRVPFYDARHQAGIATPAQDRLAFAAFDVTSATRTSLMAMLGAWTAGAARMTAGQPIGPTETLPQSPPVDTGEALGLSPARLTVTVGVGRSLFDDRFGLADRMPAALRPFGPLPGDRLDPRRTGGDLCVQACSDDPQVAFHVVRNLARIGRGTCVMRWSQLGFGRTSSTSRRQQTPRNLMGFKDGTNNIKEEDAADLDDFVWVSDETDQTWMRGGTYLVARLIRMLIESWDADFIADQEAVFGRFKTSGAPLNGHAEFDPVRLHAVHPDGTPVIPADAHIRLAAPETNEGQKILRRGYSYTDGTDPSTGSLDAGLFFICFQQDPHRQFARIQHRLGQFDGLNEYITHTGGGTFAIPPGVRAPGDWFGRALFG
jgi:deferrochelatase/peroxidase EfeB